VLTALVAFACFWVTWPKRAAISFLAERGGKTKEIYNPYREGTPDTSKFELNHKSRIRKQVQQQKLNRKDLVSHKRTLIDMLLSRQTFDSGMSSFTICRGKVMCGPEPFWSWPGGRSYR
jgi:hypothetical protein